MPCKPLLLLQYGVTPGSLAFAQAMFLKVLLITDWQIITHACEYHVK
jgi:hypothetical protein